MALTGCTIKNILPSDTPNEGRIKINQNFQCLTSGVSGFSFDSIFTTGSTGNYSIKAVNDTTIDAIGDYSYAEGNGTFATGFTSHAEGYKTTAYGYASHAEGYITTAYYYASHAEGEETIASGASSHAEGLLTITIGDGSHAEGQESKSYGQASHAEGYRSRSYGNYSHAEGENTTASGDTSHAEGKYTTAIGDDSHSEGYITIASGDGSHAEGYITIASGDGSHAEGFRTIASGNSSHSEGRYTTAFGEGSHAEGRYTTAFGYGSHAEGIFSQAIGPGSHAEGGWYDVYTSNYYSGGTAIGYASHAEGIFSQAIGLGSHAEGIETTTFGVGSHSEGENTIASGQSSHAEGIETFSNGLGSHSEGWQTTADGDYSHAEGELTRASGYSSHAEGSTTFAIGIGSHSQNVGNRAIGSYSHAGGRESIASGITSFIHSYDSIVIGDRSVVLGGQNITGTTDDTVYVPHLRVIDGVNIGTPNPSVDAGPPINVINNDAVNSINAGSGNTLSGNYSMTLGNNLRAIGDGLLVGGTSSNTSITYGGNSANYSISWGRDVEMISEQTDALCNIAVGDDINFIGGRGNAVFGNENTIKNNDSCIITGSQNRMENNNGLHPSISSSIIGGSGNTINKTTRGAIIGGISNEFPFSIVSPPEDSVIIGGDSNIMSHNRSVILGGQNITSTSNDTVYVPYLNIRDLATGTSVNSLGVDVDGNVVPGITNNITITRAEGLTLISNSGLTPTADYYISDSKIWIKAIDSHNFSRNAIKSQQIVKSTAYTGTGCLGVWTSSLTPIIGDKVIWGGRLWSNLTGNVGSSVDYTSLDGTNWSLLTSDSLYEDKLFFIIYDFVNNNISSQYDDRNNVIMPKAEYITDGYLYTDWGDTRISSNICTIITNNIPFGFIVNNECLKEGITGNIDVDIYDNECGTIRNNSGGCEILDNIVLNTIENNVVGGFIVGNYSNYITDNQISGSISSNKVITILRNTASVIQTNEGVAIQDNNISATISYNRNFQLIDNNTNPGNISRNDCNTIRNNTNNGDIINNQCISINNNSNNGSIDRNDVSDVSLNSNDGFILFNRCYRIYNNSNVGNIQSNVTQSIQSNTYNGDCSFNLADGNTDNLTIDSTGSMIFGGTGNTINNKTNVQVFSRYDFSPTDDNKTYVESLNINTLGTGTSVNSLGVDVDGNVVSHNFSDAVIPINTSSTAVGTNSYDYYMNYICKQDITIKSVTFGDLSTGSDVVRIAIYRGSDTTAGLVGQSPGVLATSRSTVNQVNINPESGQNLKFSAGESMVIGFAVGGTTTNPLGHPILNDTNLAWFNTADSASTGFPISPRTKTGSRSVFPAIELNSYSV